jgi:hypothetical protein
LNPSSRKSYHFEGEETHREAGEITQILYLVDMTSLRKEKRPTRKQVNAPDVVPGGRDVTKEGEETHEEASECPRCCTWWI